MNTARSILAVVAALGVAVLAVGCGSAARDIRGQDHGALMPAFRTIVDLAGEPSQAPSRGSLEIEVDLAGADGHLSNSGRRTGEYTMVEGAASVRFGRVFRDKIRFAGIAGLGINELDLLDFSGVPRVDDDSTEFGTKLGGEFQMEMVPGIWAHIRVASFLRPFDLIATQAEAAFVLRPTEQLGLLLGYKDWRYEHGSSHLAGVDEVDIRVDGWFVGLEMRY